MKKKFILQVVAWLLTIAMLLPSAGAALTTAYAAEGKAAHTGSVTFSDSNYWTEHQFTESELLGNVSPDDVAYINFYSDVTFAVGYSAKGSDWVQKNDATEYNVDDIRFGSGSVVKVALGKADGVDYTINWKVYTGDAKAPTAGGSGTAAGEVLNMTTKVNPDWGVYTNAISTSTLENYTNGVKVDIAFTVDSGAGYGLIGPVDAGNSWAKLAKYGVDTNFNSDDGAYLAFGPNETKASFKLSAAGVKEVISNGGGIILQGFQVNITKVTLSSLAPKATATPTPTPKPTATPTPTPVPKYTEVGESLTVTKEMVKDGVVTIKNAQYDEIIVPAGLGITAVTFNVVDVEKLVLEGGENYTVNLRNALVEDTEIAASKVKEMTYDELVAELAVAKEAEDAYAAISAVVDKFVASQKAQNDAAKAQVKLVAKDSELDTISIKANANVDVTEASVENLEVSTKDAVSRMEVKVTGFDGEATVDLDKGGREYNAPLALRFKDSAVDKLTVSGNEIFHVEGNKSSVDTMVVSGVNSVSTNLDAANLVVDEKNENADVRVYADVDNLIVEGEKNDIILPACATIESAIVAGDNIKVYGLGELGSAEVTGTGANVATLGTAVEGENDTTMPPAMVEMLPTAAPTPVPVEYKLSFPGNEVIKPFNLYKFDGNITVTVDFTLDVGAEYSQFKPMTTWWTGMYNKDTGENNFVGMNVATSGTPIYLNEHGYIFISDTTATSATFTINPTGIQLLKDQGGFTFHQQGLTITKVTLSGEKAANGGYIGNDKEAIAFSESEMAAYAGKALKVELDYSLVSGTAGTITVYSKNPDYSWAVLKETDYIDLEYTYNQYKQVEVPASKATLVLSADVVDAAIAGKGLGIQVNRNVVLNSIKLSAVEVETPDAPDTPVEPEEPEVVITSKDGAGSITFADSSWWTEQDLPIEKLLAGVAVEDVESITFTCDTSFIIGYKDVNGGWTQTPTDSATTTYTVEDVALEKFTDGNGDAHDPDFNVYLSKGNGVKYTINWTVNKKEQVLDMTYNLSAGVTVGGYGYSEENGVVTFAKQYQEIRYTLPNVIDTTTYKSVTIDMGTVKGDVAVKLYDASTKELAIKYGATGTVTFDIAELEGVITIAIMATSEGENIASVEPKTVVFTAK